MGPGPGSGSLHLLGDRRRHLNGRFLRALEERSALQEPPGAERHDDGSTGHRSAATTGPLGTHVENHGRLVLRERRRIADGRGYIFRGPSIDASARSPVVACARRPISPRRSRRATRRPVACRCGSTSPGCDGQRPWNLDTWRRGRDSNPRGVFTLTRFPGVRLKPLIHLSGERNLSRGSFAPASIDAGAEVFSEQGLHRARLGQDVDDPVTAAENGATTES